MPRTEYVLRSEVLGKVGYFSFFLAVLHAKNRICFEIWTVCESWTFFFLGRSSSCQEQKMFWDLKSEGVEYFSFSSCQEQNMNCLWKLDIFLSWIERFTENWNYGINWCIKATYVVVYDAYELGSQGGDVPFLLHKGAGSSPVVVKSVYGVGLSSVPSG